MSSNIQDLSGRRIYIRASDPAPMPKTTDLSDLVGEGKLVCHPNDIIVGKGSQWVHSRADKHEYVVFGEQYQQQRLGRGGSARCTLMIPVDWWEERESDRIESRKGRGDSFDLSYAEIAWPIEMNSGEYLWIYAGKFMATRKVDLPAFKNTKPDGSGSLVVDRTTNMHFEFSSTREIDVRGPNPLLQEARTKT